MVELDYDDMIAFRAGKKLPVMVWACTCKATKRQLQSGYCGAHATEVDQEGICIRCEHYAFKIDKLMLGLKKQRPKGLKYNKKVRIK